MDENKEINKNEQNRTQIQKTINAINIKIAEKISRFFTK